MKTWSLMYNRKCEDAFVEFIKISEYSKNSYMFRATLMLIYAYQRKDKEVIQLIDDKFLLWAKRDFQYSLFVTDIYALLNFKVD